MGPGAVRRCGRQVGLAAVAFIMAQDLSQPLSRADSLFVSGSISQRPTVRVSLKTDHKAKQRERHWHRRAGIRRRRACKGEDLAPGSGGASRRSHSTSRAARLRDDWNGFPTTTKDLLLSTEASRFLWLRLQYRGC